MEMTEAASIIRRPHVSEKGTRLTQAHNQYVFEVALEATKPQIKQAVQILFKVTVMDVHTMRTAGKQKGFRYRGRRGDLKKAIVRLKTGEKIDFIPGV